MSGKDNPGVIAFPPVIFAVAAAGGFVVHHFVPFPMFRYSVALSIGIVLALGAGTLAVWAVRVMHVAGTNVRPDQPALTIVRDGPYRFTRNPMYLALCVLQVAMAFIVDDWTMLLLVAPLAVVLHFGVILREERYLEAKFGAQYLSLKHGVRRWI